MKSEITILFNFMATLYIIGLRDTEYLQFDPRVNVHDYIDAMHKADGDFGGRTHMKVEN